MECNSTISESLTQIIHICLIALSGFQRSFKSMEVVVNAKHRNSEKNGLEINSLNRVLVVKRVLRIENINMMLL
jgi:hypothetical protein